MVRNVLDWHFYAGGAITEVSYKGFTVPVLVVVFCGCFLWRQFVVKTVGIDSDWLFYASGALKRWLLEKV